MSVRCVGFIRPPESSAGHFDHFDVVGLEPFVDRADANHARRCDRQLLGEGPGTSSCDERYQDQASPKCGTDAVDFTHPILRILAVASTICSAERLQSDLSRWDTMQGQPTAARQAGPNRRGPPIRRPDRGLRGDISLHIDTITADNSLSAAIANEPTS